jgi:hypothetical protein
MIEKDIIPLVGHPQSRSLAMSYQLYEPGIVEVAAEIASNETAVPETRRQHKCGDNGQSQPVVADERY